MPVIIIVCAYFTITFEIFIFVQQHMKFYCLLKRIFYFRSDETKEKKRERIKSSRIFPEKKSTKAATGGKAKIGKGSLHECGWPDRIKNSRYSANNT